MTNYQLLSEIADAARAMEGELDPGATMDTAVTLGVRLVGGAQEAAISLIQGRRFIGTPAATSGSVRRIDELQYRYDEGPCLDAIRESEVVYSPDVRSDARWSRWGPATAEETGFRSMMCLRLFTYGDKFGALNLYSRQTGAFDGDDREHGLAIAAQVAVAIAAAQKINQLKAGIDSRAMIGQATGILMERFDMDADRAFGVLSRLSSHGNRKLRDIAHEVIQTRRLPGTPVAEKV